MAVSPRPTDLDRAIYSTVAYRDMFHFPVTAGEIHRYLHGVRCSGEELRAALTSSAFLASRLESDGEFFCLKGRDEIFAIRRARRALEKAHPSSQQTRLRSTWGLVRASFRRGARKEPVRSFDGTAATFDTISTTSTTGHEASPIRCVRMPDPTVPVRLRVEVGVLISAEARVCRRRYSIAGGLAGLEALDVGFTFLGHLAED